MSNASPMRTKPCKSRFRGAAATVALVVALFVVPVPRLAAQPPGWTFVAPMNTPRLGAAAATGADGRIYVFGGLTAGGSKIAFSSNRAAPTPDTTTDFEIFSMDQAGPLETQLTFNGSDDLDPSWSPDGSKIAFSSNRDGDFEIFSMNADGSGQTQLTSNGSDDLDPSWSPDGTKIAFNSNRDGDFEIYTMNAGGSGTAQLTNNSVGDFGASWSPDGTKMAFARFVGGFLDVFSMNADGTIQMNLTNLATADDFAPDWSPKGTKIAFTSKRHGDAEIFSMDADGTNQMNLTNLATADDRRPAWSPDGRQIAFQSNRAAPDTATDFEIFVMNADGSGPAPLTDDPADDVAPAWKDDFLSTAEVYNPATNSWTPIAPMPTARNLPAAATGPDGRIYVMGGFFDPCAPPPPIGFPDCELKDTVEAYNPATNTWTTRAPMPTARFGHAAATGPDGRIYAIGGSTPVAIGGASNTVEAYTPKTNSWTTVAPMSTPRLSLGAATGADGRIYAIGGRTTTFGTTEVNTVEAFDTATGLWEPVAPMKTPRSLLAAATGADGRIYAIGGVDTLGGPPGLAEVQALPSGRTATWQDVASLKTPRQQLAAAADGNGRVYAIGGSSGASFLSSVEVFTPGVVRCTVNGTTVTGSPVNGTLGNDAINCSQSTAPVTINGLAGNDSIVGGAGNDTIDGGPGDDRINGGAGNDSIDGGLGNDSIDGGAGDDRIDGGLGNDRINGAAGTDTCNGGPGTDSATSCESTSGVP